MRWSTRLTAAAGAAVLAATMAVTPALAESAKRTDPAGDKDLSGVSGPNVPNAQEIYSRTDGDIRSVKVTYGTKYTTIRATYRELSPVVLAGFHIISEKKRNKYLLTRQANAVEFFYPRNITHPRPQRSGDADLTRCIVKTHASFGRAAVLKFVLRSSCLKGPIQIEAWTSDDVGYYDGTRPTKRVSKG